MRTPLIALGLLGLSLPLKALAESPNVVVDIAPLHSLVSQVMDGVESPALIIPAEASPHHYALRPSQAQALADADLVFWMGEELTPWLEKAINNVAGSAQKVGMLDIEATTTYPFREGATFEEHAHHDEEEYGEEHHEDEHAHHDSGHDDEHHEETNTHDEHEHGPSLVDRFLSLFSSDDHGHDEEHAHHDEHGHGDSHDDEHDGKHEDEHEGHDDHHHDGIDPHAWLAPNNAKLWIAEIAKVLSEKDPENSSTYEENASNAIAELDKLIDQTSAEISALGDIRFIVFHDAYQYFEKSFGIAASGSISLGDAEDPSPARIAEIRNTVQDLGVTCVFAEPQYDDGLVNNIFEGSTITAIGVMDPLGASLEVGKTHYANLIRGMAASLAQCKN